MTHGTRNSMMTLFLTCGLLCTAAAGVARAQTEGVARITGTWDITLTVRNCSTGEPITAFREIATFNRGGTLIASTSGLAPSAKTPGHGVWRHVGGQSYEYAFKFFRFDGTGALAGWNIVRQAAEVEDDTYEAQGGVEVYNHAGVQVGAGCSSTAATRFE